MVYRRGAGLKSYFLSLCGGCSAAVGALGGSGTAAGAAGLAGGVGGVGGVFEVARRLPPVLLNWIIRCISEILFE